MLKIEVRIKTSFGERSIEREYCAELPDTATPAQIKAVQAGAEQAAKVKTE